MRRTHGRYAYSNITERPDYSWPGGKRLAVYVAVNIEQFSYNESRSCVQSPCIPSSWDVLTAFVSCCQCSSTSCVIASISGSPGQVISVPISRTSRRESCRGAEAREVFD